MDRIQLGRTGRTISRPGLGAMSLSLDGRPEREAARGVIRRALELGVDFIDTADAYCIDNDDFHHNERLIREALADVDRADAVIVATKGGLTRPDGRWERDARPERLRRTCEASLQALDTERIDLYQLHAPDPSVPFEESVGAIADLQQEGKLGAVGLSNVSLEHLRAAEEIVEITSVQNRFNPWDRRSETSGLLEYCDEGGITFIPYSPLGGSRRVRLVGESRELREIGEELDATPHEVVLAWILSRSPTLCPIPGATRERSIESSVRSTEIPLDEEASHRVESSFASLPA